MPLLQELHKEGVGLIGYSHWCPACDHPHAYYTTVHYVHEGRSNPVWTFNGNLTAPTFSPSMSIKWAYKANQEDAPDIQRCCHYNLTDGMITFHGDCTHSLVGQKVPLPPWPESPTDG